MGNWGSGNSEGVAPIPQFPNFLIPSLTKMLFRQTRSQWLMLAAVVVATLLPRVSALDRFVTTDEPLWVTRAANFACSLAQRDPAGTFQREHPGVTAMWAGAAGLLMHAPAYGQTCSYLADKEEHEEVLRALGLEPIRLLSTARTWMVLGNTLALALAYLYARRLLGEPSALVGFLLIAFAPFIVAHSRLLHLDALLSSLLLLALLAFVSHIHGRRGADVIVSGVAAGLSWLTKSPGVLLAPYVGGLVLFSALWARQGPECQVPVQGGKASAAPEGSRSRRFLRQVVWPLLVWTIVAGATFVLLWPAMWVDPAAVLGKMLNLASGYASAGHGSPTFFDGVLVPDGRLGARFWYFYPLTWLWRTTPSVLLGLPAAVMAFLRHASPLDRPKARYTTVALVLFSVLWATAMSLSTKKFDRYLLPAYAPLNLAAATGWVAMGRLLGRSQSALVTRYGLALLLGIVVFSQLAVAGPTFPYYLSYYNPLLGGSRRAPKVMLIGWGEGLDQVARYLNGKSQAAGLNVSAWYRTGPFSYFFEGASNQIPNQDKWMDINLSQILNGDYAVTYHVHQQQRQAPGQLLAALDKVEPERVFWINGLEYARIYRLAHELRADPAYVRTDARIGESILLEGYKLPAARFAPGDVVPIWLSWRALDAPGERLKVFLHLLATSSLAAQQDAEPVAWSRPTDGWQAGEQITDGYGVSLPADLPPGDYTLVVGMYRPSGERLPVTQNGKAAGDILPLAQIAVRPEE